MRVGACATRPTRSPAGSLPATWRAPRCHWTRRSRSWRQWTPCGRRHGRKHERRRLGFSAPAPGAPDAARWPVAAGPASYSSPPARSPGAPSGPGVPFPGHRALFDSGPGDGQKYTEQPIMRCPETVGAESWPPDRRECVLVAESPIAQNGRVSGHRPTDCPTTCATIDACPNVTSGQSLSHPT